MRHAEYLRHRTKAALEDEGFPAVFGEAPSMLKFWQSFLSSPNAAVSETLEAKKVCGAVVIFPASFGSLAELCLFARQGQIADKTLAVVDKTYEAATSFFRQGVLELFESFSGTTRFVDYKEEDTCIERVLRFVSGRYHRVLDELDQDQYIRTRHRGHIFENKANIAPIDTALLGLIQLVQPTSLERLKVEAAGTILEALCRRNQIDEHLARLERDGFLLRTASGAFVVAPNGYELVSRGLSAKARIKPACCGSIRSVINDLGWEHRFSLRLRTGLFGVSPFIHAFWKRKVRGGEVPPSTCLRGAPSGTSPPRNNLSREPESLD